MDQKFFGSFFQERTSFSFFLRTLRADLGNFGPIHHRYVDGFLISGKNSGSHWLKHMLSVAIAHDYGIKPPRFTSGREADRIVGRASRARLGQGTPVLVTSHTIPSALVARLPRGWVREPPIVLLVRNIPDAMRSNYLKWRERYGVDFSTFVRGDPSGKRFIADAWWYVHFFNRWGDFARAQPDRVQILRYEAMVADPEHALRAAAAHFRLSFSDGAIAAALEAGDKDRMRARQDPDAGETILPLDESQRPDFSGEDRVVLAGILRRLRHDLGYGPVGGVPPAGKGLRPLHPRQGSSPWTQ